MSTETKATHTPGPWRYDNGHVLDPTNTLLIVSGVSMPMGVHPKADEAEANARLIAAAPELLKALRAVRCDFCGFSVHQHVIGGASHTCIGGNHTPQTIANAVATIRKAEGAQ